MPKFDDPWHQRIHWEQMQEYERLKKEWEAAGYTSIEKYIQERKEANPGEVKELYEMFNAAAVPSVEPNCTEVFAVLDTNSQVVSVDETKNQIPWHKPWEKKDA